MKNNQLNEIDITFLSQSNEFLKRLLSLYGYNSLSEVELISKRNCIPIEPVVIKDYKFLSAREKTQIKNQYFSDLGVTYFVILNDFSDTNDRHPLIEISSQLQEELSLFFPVEHPKEKDESILNLIGKFDNTVKVFDHQLNQASGTSNSENFSMHQDGLGSGGTIQTVGLFADSVPLCGGFTFFQNILRLSLDLAKLDYEAFVHLLLPDAITIMRPTGARAIKVTAPILYFDKTSDPQTIFNSIPNSFDNSEYTVIFREHVDALKRAIDFLKKYSQPFCNGSSFISFSNIGQGCLIRNLHVIHGRTWFIDDPKGIKKRVISRKWFATTERDSIYKHCPGISILDEYAKLRPDLFDIDLLDGDWKYHESIGENRRIK